MKKAIFAASIVAVAALTTLTVSSKTRTAVPAEVTKANKTTAAATVGFSTQKSDISSID